MTGYSPSLSPAHRLADSLARSGMLICPTCRTTYSSSRLTLCYRDGAALVDYDRFVAIERDPLRGTVIGGKYRLIERVGQGGMGTVYRATQTGLNRPVAVKILKRELNLDPDTVARFQREADAMSRLAHPNTVRVYDFGQTDDGLLYLVMELLVGELITDRMLQKGPLDVLEAVRFTQQILRSLAEAHSHAIVHRDLKPDNVFVARLEGHDEPVVKVLDFGIAKVVAPDRRVDQFETQAGTVFGTPRYMSPEQAQGASLDGRSDLYTVGTLLSQMLSGRAPFTDDDAVVVMAKHIREVPEEPIVTVPERPIPGLLNDVVMRALEKDPAHRFQDAAEFDAALEACVPDVVSAQRAVMTGRWPKRRTQSTGWVWSGVALTLFALGFALVAGMPWLKTAHGVTSVALTAPEAMPAYASQPTAVPLPESRPHPTATASHETGRGRQAQVGVALRSSPSGATVYRAGKRLGETPLRLSVAPSDRVRVELRMNGYQTLDTELTARDGTRTLALKPVRTKRVRRTPPARATPTSLGHASRTSEASGGSAVLQPAASSKSGPYERFE
ncbi:MAG: serine/threonine-protein kinase [Polyangiales bacterium]